MSDRNWERVAHQEASPPSRQLLATRTEEAHIATHVQQAAKGRAKGHRQRNVLLEGAAGAGQPEAKTKKQGLKRSARYPAVLGLARLRGGLGRWFAEDGGGPESGPKEVEEGVVEWPRDSEQRCAMVTRAALIGIEVLLA